ncbi:unnamed protein product [Heligmosomoides polygyrus]|uniref:PKD_channel domain-containing protein n=1 Tax=Heligmosomoides polygyrus TaxID=6339 RepID=A0A3P7ZT06_HELPZ|nr:unnamed protein product [Heligmosomoides polygyrus]
MEEEAADGVDNFDDLESAKHPCSKFLVRVCAPHSDFYYKAHEYYKHGITRYVFQWLLFGSFPMMSLLSIIITGAVMKVWPRISQTVLFSPTMLHVLCLFSLFYMVLESMFESFYFMYNISNSLSGATAPWGPYLLSSLYTLLLWFFFLNFLVNMQLTEFDCRMAREVAGALNDGDGAAIAD